MMTLKRIIEPSSGRILIDGVDIASVRLFDLRSRLALVPQVWVIVN
jgi:ABC-type multidrug transport system fused ATPase/permease subunit